MLVLSITMNTSAGLLTWHALDNMTRLSEANALLTPLLSYGAWTVLIFDAGCAVVFSLAFMLTKRFRYLHPFMMSFILSATGINFMRDLSLVLGI